MSERNFGACESCLFWIAWGDGTQKHVVMGECRKHAPIGVDANFRGVWPKLTRYDACGDHAPRVRVIPREG